LKIDHRALPSTTNNANLVGELAGKLGCSLTKATTIHWKTPVRMILPRETLFDRNRNWISEVFRKSRACVGEG